MKAEEIRTQINNAIDNGDMNNWNLHDCNDGFELDTWVDASGEDWILYIDKSIESLSDYFAERLAGLDWDDDIMMALQAKMAGDTTVPDVRSLVRGEEEKEKELRRLANLFR